MRTALRASWLVLCVGATVSSSARAQTGWSVSLELDNDFFVGFSPTESTDYEYTHGTRITAIRRTPGPLCPGTSAAWSIHHRLFTPRVERRNPLVGQRRHAAWLRGGLTCSFVTPRQEDRVSYHFGLVGPAAGGKELQSMLHRLLGFRDPNGWENQIETWVDVGLALERRRVLVNQGRTNGILELRAELSTVRSNAGGGLTVVFEVSEAPFSLTPKLRISTTGSVELVLQNKLLDGVQPTAYVAVGGGDVEVTLGRVGIVGAVTIRTREYVQEPGGFVYGTLGLRLDL